jgi:hypothetical protein
MLLVMLRRFALAAVASFVVFSPGVASAFIAGGCFATCEIQLSEVHVEPDLGCFNVEAMDDTCNCGIELSLENDCATSVERVRGRFEYCGAPTSGERRSCSSLAPGEVAAESLAAPGNGFRRWVVPITSQGVEHRVVLEGTITKLDVSGCTCPGVPESAARGRRPAHIALATFSLWFLVWRRRARKSR